MRLFITLVSIFSFYYGCTLVYAAPAIIKSNSLVLEQGITESFVQLQTRPDATTNILLLEPKNPHASVVLFAGGGGRLIINEDNSIENGTNFLVRSRQLFAQNGLRTIVIDGPSDHWDLSDQRTNKWHMQDIAAVMAYARSLSPIPVWLVGTSRGTISVAAAGATLQDQPPNGIVLTASVLVLNKGDSIYDADLKKITAPVLVVHHDSDGCWVTPYDDAKRVMDDLPNAARKELITISGGDPGSGSDCDAISYHGFLGVEPETVGKIATWIKNQVP